MRSKEIAQTLIALVGIGREFLPVLQQSGVKVPRWMRKRATGWPRP